MRASNYIRAAAFTALAFCLVTARAAFSGAFTTEYVIGDGETKAAARAAALDQLKKIAASAAGSYVQTTTVMESAKDLKESVEVLTASVVRLADIKERSAINGSGQLVLQLAANATVDEAELARRIKALQEDKSKLKLLRQVQAENLSLRRDLEKVRASMGKSPSQADTSELLRRQFAALKGIEDNAAKVQGVFEPGAIISAATDDDEAFKALQRDVYDRLLESILNAQVTSSMDGAEKVNDRYIVRVNVAWKFDAFKLSQYLSQYLDVRLNDGDLYIEEKHNSSGNGPSPFSERLFRFLATQEVDLVVSAGKGVVRVPVFYYGSGYQTCTSYGYAREVWNRSLCLVSKDRRTSSQRAGAVTENGQVRISLTADEAREVTRVDARMEHSNPGR